MGAKIVFTSEREKMIYMIRKMARFLWQAYGTKDYKSLLSKEAEETLLDLFDMSKDIVGDDLFSE